MTLSVSSVETLVDLVEIKMLCMMQSDSQDQRAIAVLIKCRAELIAIAKETQGVKLVPFSMSPDFQPLEA